MKRFLLLLIAGSLSFTCSKNMNNNFKKDRTVNLAIGGDFSILKKIEDQGGIYKFNGTINKGLHIFKENGFTWCRLRIFHTPNMIGPVVNDLEYTIALEQQAKEYGFKFLLNFHYSDTWADPGKQHLPKAWEALGLKELTDSVYRYTHNVMMKMKGADVYPDMVQIGNEINNGMLWPHGYLWPNNEPVRWYELAQLLKAGIKAVKDTDADNSTDIMIHAATGGDIIESDNFYANLQLHGVEFDIIGLSYYPWWHGTFDELEKNLNFLSGKYQQQISVVETAYYANGWYPEPDEFTLDIQPYPPTEPGQYSYMRELAVRLKKFPKVTSLFYWEPEAIEVPDSQLYYLGRSLFSRDGNAFMGISAWKNE